MLRGTGRVEDFEKVAPKMESLDTEALTFANAEVMQVLCEIYSDEACDLLPPALHPTLPPVVCWTVYRFPETEWGEVRLAQTRIECRSGLRPGPISAATRPMVRPITRVPSLISPLSVG